MDMKYMDESLFGGQCRRGISQGNKKMWSKVDKPSANERLSGEKERGLLSLPPGPSGKRIERKTDNGNLSMVAVVRDKAPFWSLNSHHYHCHHHGYRIAWELDWWRKQRKGVSPSLFDSRVLFFSLQTQMKGFLLELFLCVPAHSPGF